MDNDAKWVEMMNLESKRVTPKIMSYLENSRKYFPPNKTQQLIKFYTYLLNSIKDKAVCWAPLGRASTKLLECRQGTRRQGDSECSLPAALVCLGFGGFPGFGASSSKAAHLPSKPG